MATIREVDAPLPMLVFDPVGAPGPAVLVFHGLSASKDAQKKEGFSLAAAGFTAVVPDAPHHGARRDALLDRMRDATDDEAHALLLQLVTEASAEVPGLVEWLRARGHARVAALGISMGAFTALAAAADERRIDAVVSILGSPDWTPRGSGRIPAGLESIVARAPARRLDAFPPRPLFLANAGLDVHVPAGPARAFADALRPRYASSPSDLEYHEYPSSEHFMREEDWDDLWRRAIEFLRRALR